MNTPAFLKIKTLTIMVSGILALFATINIFSNYILNKDLARIQENWNKFQEGPVKKHFILSDLRNALGYGGMIHNFKNFVLRSDRKFILVVQEDLLKVSVLLTAYQNIGINDKEKAAIDVLDSRLSKYAQAIALAEKMARDGYLPQDIDSSVRVNDELAFKGMLSLVGQLEEAHTKESHLLDLTVENAKRASGQFVAVSVILAFFSIGFLSWFMFRRILGPMKSLSFSMERISRGDTNHPVEGTQRTDEIGDMAKTVEIFRTVMVERNALELTLLETKELAESSNRAKSVFLATMSHELRTPLNGIIGASEMIKEGIFGPLENEKYAEYVDEIYNSGSHLLGLVENILDVSDIDAKSVTLDESTIDLVSLIDECVKKSINSLSHKNIQLNNQTAGTSFPVVADASRIGKVLDHALSNAIKFTPDNGTILIDAFYEEDGGVAVSITDSGIGMHREAIETALAPFGQVNRGTFAKHEGAGLGLYLSRLIMEMHGGSLRLKSSPNGGTRVTIFLPKDRTVS